MRKKDEFDGAISPLYAEMAELTNPICAQCDPPYHCCEVAGCNKARNFAKAMHGIELFEGDGALPYLADNGCTVATYLRPLCTMWLCLEALDRLGPGTPQRYWELRAEIIKLESLRWKKKLPA